MKERAKKRIALIRTLLNELESLEEVISNYEEIAKRDYASEPNEEMYFYETWLGATQMVKYIEKELEKLC